MNSSTGPLVNPWVSTHDATNFYAVVEHQVLEPTIHSPLHVKLKDAHDIPILQRVNQFKEALFVVVSYDSTCIWEILGEAIQYDVWNVSAVEDRRDLPKLA